MTTAIYDTRYTCWNGRPANPGHKGGGLRPYLPIRIVAASPANSSVAYLNIVTSSDQVEARAIAQRNVERPTCVATHRILAVSGIVTTGFVIVQRTLPVAVAVVAGCVAMERVNAGGRVIDACYVATKRLKPVARVVAVA
jgi:hypothetical protein